jgi:N-acyl-L-homoserine lactone synthetase
MFNCNYGISEIKQEANDVMRAFLDDPAFADLRFARIETSQDRDRLRAFRLKVYGKNLRYMLNQIGESGFDEYDDHSYIFAIWKNDDMAASIRLTPAPFESAQYINGDSLTAFLGERHEFNYLEWSRLLVDTSLKIKGLVSAMTIYAGLYVLIHTDYTKYFGYTRHSVRRLFSGFEVNKESLQFRIPSRGEHFYLLLKGSFINDLYKLNVKV